MAVKRACSFFVYHVMNISEVRSFLQSIEYGLCSILKVKSNEFVVFIFFLNDFCSFVYSLIAVFHKI